MGTQSLPSMYSRHSASKDGEFLEYLMAIIYVESGFERNAKSSKDARGLMQLTLPAIQDAVKHCELKPVLNMDSLYDSITNIRYGTCYLKKLYDEMDGDWTRTLIAYNGGYYQVMRYDRGVAIAPESANYVLKVMKARQQCLN